MSIFVYGIVIQSYWTNTTAQHFDTFFFNFVEMRYGAVGVFINFSSKIFAILLFSNWC